MSLIFQIMCFMILSLTLILFMIGIIFVGVVAIHQIENEIKELKEDRKGDK